MDGPALERYIERLVDEKFKRRRKPRITKSRRKLTLADVGAMETGPELTAYDIERISGISDETVRREIQQGRIAYREERRGRVTYFWIAFVEAKRYLLQRGKLRAA
jgi:Fic family protein